MDRAHGVAPHKPILLLAVAECFERGKILENRINLSPELNRIFLKYWSYLGSEDHHPDISRPYFHMKSGKFWHLMMNPGFEHVLAAKIKLRTFCEVKIAVDYAYLDEDLFDLLKIDKYRESLLAVLVGTWFPGRFSEIRNMSEVDDFKDPPWYFIRAYEKYMNRLEDV